MYNSQYSQSNYSQPSHDLDSSPFLSEAICTVNFDSQLIQLESFIAQGQNTINFKPIFLIRNKFQSEGLFDSSQQAITFYVVNGKHISKGILESKFIPENIVVHTFSPESHLSSLYNNYLIVYNQHNSEIISSIDLYSFLIMEDSFVSEGQLLSNINSLIFVINKHNPEITLTTELKSGIPGRLLLRARMVSR
ncbi:MAG: hypothetical protein ACOCQD_05130 [archaeon]